MILMMHKIIILFPTTPHAWHVTELNRQDKIRLSGENTERNDGASDGMKHKEMCIYFFIRQFVIMHVEKVWTKLSC